MRALLSLLLCLSLAAPMRAEEAVAAAPSSGSGQRKVSVGKAYGANTFAGLAVGALIGSAMGALPYATERKNQGPESVILGSVFGALGGAVGLGLPFSAYEVAADKPGAGITAIYNVFGFAVLGGVVGGGAGMISYRRKVDYDPRSAEDFLGAAAGGVLGGALVGVGVGLADAVFWQGRGMNVPGKGIHAKAGLMDVAGFHDDGISVSALPNATLLKAEF